MSAWRLEWLRLVRTARGVSLIVVFVFYGLLGPILAKYMANLVRHVNPDSGISITITRPPLPKDGMIGFINQVGNLGLVVTVVVAAGALAFDSRRGVSTFFRTRARGMWDLVAPRVVIPASAAIGAFTAGTLVAWYETTILIGPLPVGTLVTGWAVEVLFFVFVVGVVAASSSVVRSAIGAIGVAIGSLLVFPVVGVVGAVHDWLPTTLMTVPVDLLNGTSIDRYVPALLVTVVLTPLLLAVAVNRFAHRDA